MKNERARIDWDEARGRLQEAETALERALVADPEKIERVYRDRAIQMAKRRTRTVDEARTISVLVFSLGRETYGIAISEIVEVLPSAKCTPVPRAAAEIAGVINLRGELRSVIDLRRLLSLPPADDEPVSCILMLRNGRDEVGLKVGQVEKVQTIREDELVASPEIAGAEESGGYIKALSPDKVIVLNPAALRLHPVLGNPR
jgi:purine-binding chemotaxis protein CheW